MKNFFVFLWRATIPMLWLLSVLAAFRVGFQLGLVPSLPPGETYPYPWLGVMLTSVVTAIESAFLYLILRPDKLVWSLPRVGGALVLFFSLSILVAYTTVTDLPGYAYVPGGFTLILTFLLFILLIITIMIAFVKRLSEKAKVRKI